LPGITYFPSFLLVVHSEIFSFRFHSYSLAQEFRSLSEFADHLSANVDIVFPVIHGKFGEDGGIQVSSYQTSSRLKFRISNFLYVCHVLANIQELLEKKNIPFVGTPSNECRRAFDKV
jgi:D-alanine-D-alanine ligase-like ATP-grasp enzyme